MLVGLGFGMIAIHDDEFVDKIERAKCFVEASPEIVVKYHMRTFVQTSNGLPCTAPYENAALRQDATHRKASVAERFHPNRPVVVHTNAPRNAIHP